MKKILLNQVPLVAWMLLIFWLSSIPRVPVIVAPIEMDKVAHASVFFILSWFAYRAFRYQERIDILRRWAILAGLVFAAIYGISDEFHQRFVPGRTFDVFDMLADATGAALFAISDVIANALKRRRERRQQPRG